MHCESDSIEAIKTEESHQIEQRNAKMTKKIMQLRENKRKTDSEIHTFKQCLGSRKIFGMKYIKENSSGIPGSPFPKNLCPSRRNRPHSKLKHTPPPQTCNYYKRGT